LDLLGKSGEFPVSNEELDDIATTVYGEIWRKRSAWCKPVGERSARSPAIWELGYRRWIGGSRDRRAVDPSAAASDVTAELKRLRRENEILGRSGTS
jgi:hypothetical protein